MYFELGLYRRMNGMLADDISINGELWYLFAELCTRGIMLSQYTVVEIVIKMTIDP